MVVAAHPLAVEAGVAVLQQGGNAVDAAVAVAFALNAAEPFASGIGGGGFMLIYLAKDRKATVINFREKAPSSATPTMFREKGEAEEEWRTARGTAVGVPGALAGWDMALKKYGTRRLDEVILPAAEIAEKGFAVSPTFSFINKDEYERILTNGGEGSCYLKDGFPFEPGDFYRNPDLASTLRHIAAKGIDEFYKGGIARKVVDAVKAKDGLMTLEDLASYEAVEVRPLEGAYKGITFYTIPPPGSGAHLIQFLNMVERWPVGEWKQNSPAYIHHLSEALRLVFADRDRCLGDPDFVSVPVDQLLSKDYAAQAVSRIKPDGLIGSYHALEFEEGHSGNTTHVCVLDKDGNIVSLSQSINDFFGTGIIPEGTGFILNDHMDDFASDPDSPNAPGPRRRPASSMAPLIMFRDGRPFLILGSPGGTRIFPSLGQIILNIVDFSMSLDEAIEAPRFFSYSSEGKARSLSVESRIPEATLKELERIGHKITLKEAYDKYFGGAQGIIIPKEKKSILGGADSRRDGWGKGY